MQQKVYYFLTKNCETVIEQTLKNPEETLEFKMTKTKETFHFNPLIQVKEDWMLVVVDLNVYNSICIKTEQNNKFQLYKFRDEIVVVLHMKKSEKKLKRAWICRKSKLPIYKTIC